MSPGKNVTMLLYYMHNYGKKMCAKCDLEKRVIIVPNTKEMKKDSRLN